MRAHFRKYVMALFTALSLVLPAASFANAVDETPSALAMTGDAVIARPALLAITVIGAVTYVVSLPFSALGGNAGEAAEVLFIEPAKATFVRCLGCSTSGRKYSAIIEQSESQ